MKTIDVKDIINGVEKMCYDACHILSDDMKGALDKAVNDEESSVGRQILGQLQENLVIAREKQIPICQDTGMAVFFVKLGQDVHIEGGLLEDAINLLGT